MKNLFSLLLTLSILCTPFLSQANVAGNDVVGKWNYEVPYAPEGYEKGSMVFSEEDGELSGKVVFSDGYELSIKNLKVEGDELSCGIYVEGEYISIKMSISGGTMQGQVNTPDGALDISAVKE